MSEFNLIICLLSVASLVISLICVAIVAGFTRSTHTVQYEPYQNDSIIKASEELAKENAEVIEMPIGRKNKDHKKAIMPLDESIGLEDI